MKKLIIAPHIDDEVLGCGGILNEDCFVYYCGIDEGRLKEDSKYRISSEKRKQELKNVAKFFGFKYKINTESKVNSYKINEFIAEIEELINEVKPESIYIPYPSFNHDHKTIYQACIVALRQHDKNFFVRKVLIYEEIQDFAWSGEEFSPNYFVKIDINRKLECYCLHESQVRSMRSPEMIKTHARLRGIMAKCEYAEAFQVLRWVDN